MCCRRSVLQEPLKRNTNGLDEAKLPGMRDDDFIHRAFHGDGSLRTVLEFIVSILISISVLLLILEITTDPDAETREIYGLINNILLTVFALEIGLRIGSFRPPSLDFY